jgi:hypothetical protein
LTCSSNGDAAASQRSSFSPHPPSRYRLRVHSCWITGECVTTCRVCVWSVVSALLDDTLLWTRLSSPASPSCRHLEGKEREGTHRTPRGVESDADRLTSVYCTCGCALCLVAVCTRCPLLLLPPPPSSSARPPAMTRPEERKTAGTEENQLVGAPRVRTGGAGNTWRAREGVAGPFPLAARGAAGEQLPRPHPHTPAVCSPLPLLLAALVFLLSLVQSTELVSLLLVCGVPLRPTVSGTTRGSEEEREGGEREKRGSTERKGGKTTNSRVAAFLCCLA